MTRRPLALVTGASGGIGLELARQLAAGGHDLILVARSAGRLADLADTLRLRWHGSVETRSADLSDPGTVDALGASLADREIGVLVNNAGVGVHGPFAEQDLEQVRRMLSLNIDALTALTRLALPGMLARRRGRILNVASMVAFQPGGPGVAAYYASKAYVLSFSRGLAVELRGTGVTVTALCPGATRTGFEGASGMQDTALYRWFTSIPAEAVARVGLRGMMRGRAVVVPGMLTKVLALAGQLPPSQFALEVNRLLLRRPR